MRKLVWGAIAGILGGSSLLAVFLLVRQEGICAEDLLAAYRQTPPSARLTIRYPFDEAVFPPEAISPTFRWTDATPGVDRWLVAFEFDDGGERLAFESDSSNWMPPEEAWDTIKRRSQQCLARAVVLGLRRGWRDRVASAGEVFFRTSLDKVGAPIFYREVNLPFVEAVKDPSKIRWRFGPVSSREQPPVVLENLPVCGNCHSFSSDGKTLGMDVDYANDKGSYAVVPVAENVVLASERILTWSQFKPEDRQPTHGLLSQVSPDGRYVVSTVKDESVFLPTDDLTFSQLFFPVRGILAVYDRQSGTFRELRGANDPAYVQSNAVWSPDGKWIVFARSKVHRLRRSTGGGVILLSKEDCKEFLEGGEKFLFDLYRIPFNDGRGGTPEPLAGASHNGASNYFPKYSPDGKWIVCCRAKSFMLLQPDSELFILPAEGGEPRRLRGNAGRMNSWHSWSPNGRWLVFSSKAFTAYTELFLTHIDAQGESSPPVLLERFTSPDRAANIPEFVQAKPNGIRQIQEAFLNDYSYAGVAVTNLQAGDLDKAEKACRKALELNSASASALCNLGVILMERRQFKEAEKCFRDSLRSNAADPNALSNLGIVLCMTRRATEGVQSLRDSVRIDPQQLNAQCLLGAELVNLGKYEEASEHLRVAVEIAPNHPDANYLLGKSLEKQGRDKSALAHYLAATKHNPRFVPPLIAAARIHGESTEEALRDPAVALQYAERACRLTQFRNAEALAALAVAYAASGRHAEALAAAQQSLATARAAGNEQLVSRLGRRLEEYRRKASSPTDIAP